MSKPIAGIPQSPRRPGQRLSELLAAANDDAPEPTLRLVAPVDPEADNDANSLLLELYAHISASEAERSAPRG